MTTVLEDIHLISQEEEPLLWNKLDHLSHRFPALNVTYKANVARKQQCDIPCKKKWTWMSSILVRFYYRRDSQGWRRTELQGYTLPLRIPALDAAPPPAAPSPAPRWGSRGRHPPPARSRTWRWCCDTAPETAHHFWVNSLGSPRRWESSVGTGREMRLT